MDWQGFWILIICSVGVSTVANLLVRSRWAYLVVAVSNVILSVGLIMFNPGLAHMQPGLLFGMPIALGLVVTRSVRGAGWGRNR